MLENYPYAIPHGKITVRACVVNGKEIIEIRACDRKAPETEGLFWYQEAEAGCCLTDFLYVDLTVMKAQLLMMHEAITAINAGEDPTESFLMLRELYQYWKVQGTFFAPFVAAIMRLFADQGSGKKLSLTEIKKLAARYEELQAMMKQIAEVFAEDRAGNLAYLYLFRHERQPERYPLFSYGHVQLETFFIGDIVRTFYFNEPGREETYQTPRKPVVAETLVTESPDDLMGYMVNKYLIENVHFRTCKYCGRYFGITGNYKTDYCNRQIEGSSKTCKEAGSLRLYEQRTMENPAIREYKRSYKAHNARVRYGIMTREEFNKWSEAARAKRDQCVAGELSLEDFVAWLDSDKRTQ